MKYEKLDEQNKNVVISRHVKTYPKWNENANYIVGDKAVFNGALYRCRQSHISIQDWIPTATQALWELIK